MSEPVLAIEGLSLHVRTDAGDRLKIVDDLSFEIGPGQFFALIGESGSGKSMVARAIMRLAPDEALDIDGAIRFGGVDLARAPERDLRAMRGSQISMIFQEPMSSLDPLMTIEAQLGEAIAAHRACSRAERRARMLDLLRKVRFRDPERVLGAYPHELSGGMRQRVMIAGALVNAPKLLIADEPTTALDVTIQAQVVDIITNLARDEGLAVLFISHDLSLVYEQADEIAVLYGGVLMERGPARSVIANPSHPYTAALIACVPRRRTGGRQAGIEGAVPPVSDWWEGCRFAPRCPRRQPDCTGRAIPLTGDARRTRCVAPLTPELQNA
jgi:oligopeptide/dipeptide ABC transporter ATP-binding protein